MKVINSENNWCGSSLLWFKKIFCCSEIIPTKSYNFNNINLTISISQPREGVKNARFFYGSNLCAKNYFRYSILSA